MTGSDRGRVPFALVGVLLLVSSATLAATSDPVGSPDEPAVGSATKRAVAETQTAVRDGVRAASRDAARAPVVERANTAVGHVLNESEPFRDSLRIRIYLAVRDRLEPIERHRDDVSVGASLPPVSNASQIRSAKRRVHVQRADENGTAITVEIRNVTVTASRDGRVVSERKISPRVTVATPILALHERVSTYQRRLDANVSKPGLDQRLTAQLYALAWARGYGQYGGLPIDNVIANRHVAIATNAGLLDVQRSTIGHSDPAGRRTLARATVKTGAMDLVAASGTSTPPGTNPFSSPTRPPPNDVTGLRPTDGQRPDDARIVGVNRTADAALLDLVANGSLDETIGVVYGADARLVSAVDRVDGSEPPAPASPPGDWRLVDEGRTVRSEPGTGDVAPPRTPTGWHRFRSFGRTVEVTRTRTRTWQRANETRRTSTRATETVRVAVAVVGRHHTSGRAPKREIRGVHSRGRGPLDGPNLAGVENRSIDRLVDERGGADALVRRAALGELDTDPVRVDARTPRGIDEWVYRDLMSLRDRVRAITVQVERGRVGTFEANPPAMLADRVRDRRTELIDAPATYDGVASKARIAARAAYLDRVVAKLETRADRRERRGNRLGETLRDRSGSSLSEARRGMQAATRSPREGSGPVTGVGGPVQIRVDSAPSYLTTGEVSSERVPAVNGSVHPLAARNVNVFALPYGDASDAVVDVVGGGSSGRVRLGTAARTLRAANETLERRDNATLRERRDALQKEVARANRFLASRLRTTLADRGVGDSRARRRSLVSRGLARWNTTATRAIALSNGSAPPAIAATAAAETNVTAVERDRLRLRLSRANREARRRPLSRPRLGAVNESRRATRSVATEVTRRLARNATERAAARAMNGTMEEVPAGLPLAPVPGYWYATMNVWHVTVRGEYARFGVRADRGRPTSPGGGLTYARDGDIVRIDVDDDGRGERLGRATRVDFDVSTTVIVVVPPGGSGIGDRGGNADERSSGWPGPE